MTAPNAGIPGLACLPTAIPPVERDGHFARARKLFIELAEERSDITNGYAFRFSPDMLEQLAKFVANERKCCPFMCFEISLGADSGPLWLRMTGPQGTREVIRAELDLPGSCGCG